MKIYRFLTSTFLSYLAAKNGDLDILKYAHKNGYHWNNSICAVASNLECLKFLHENGCP